MLGKKHKSVIDVKEIATFPEKLPRSLQPFLSNEERQKYTFESPYPQEFSLPSNIICYVAKNPTFPNGHLKLISTCKSVFCMSRILPIKEIVHCEYEECNKWLANQKVSINLKNPFFKLWIYEELNIWTLDISNVATALVKHVYKFSLQKIDIRYQDLIFKELQILVSGSNLESVYFDNNVVKNDDESIVEFEKAFELLCCKKMGITFHPEQHGFGKNTTLKIIEMLSSDQIQNEMVIDFENIPQNFDFHLFSDFLRLNLDQKQHTFRLNFSEEISEAYKKELQEFVNEIVQIRGIYAHTVPIIEFPDQDMETYIKLDKMRYENVEGILQT